MNAFPVSLSALLLLSLAACHPFVHSHDLPAGTFAPLNAAPHEVKARPGSKVELFSGAAPTKPFVEVGLADAYATHPHDRDVARIMQKLRDVAGGRGCDALYNVRSHDRSGCLGFQATCIVYRDEAPASAAPSAAAAE